MKTIPLLALATMAGFLSGCVATTPSANVKPLTDSNTTMDLRKYRLATVVPFATDTKGVKDPSIGETFARDLAWRLNNSYGPIFSEINVDSASNRTDELIVTGELTQYDPGSRELRSAIGLGLGAASLDGKMILKDAADQHVVYEAEFSKLWAFGGLAGGERDIENLRADTIAAIGNTIAIARGWKPPVAGGNAHPDYSTYRAGLPMLTTNQARIWFYRPHSIVAWAVVPTVRLDDQYVGTAINGGFFCVTVPPGKHQITDVLPTKPTYATVEVAGGSETYVFVRMTPEPVSETKGTKEIAGLRLYGE